MILLMAFGLIPMCGLHQEAQLDGAHLRLIGALADLIARADGPGKIVDVVAVIGNGLRVVGVILLADLDSAGTDNLVLWDGQLHIVDAKVGEELGCGVVLVAVPRSVPPDPDLGKPLSAE